MEFIGYDTFWLIAAGLFLVPAIFTAVCRQVLRHYSRKVLFERIPPEEHERLEESLSRKDDYQASLEHVEFVLRVGLAVSLLCGHLLWLERTPSEGLLRDFDLLRQVLHVAAVGAQVVLASALFLGVIPSVIAGGWAERCLLRVLPAVERVHRTLVPFRWLLQRFIGILALLLAGRRQRTSQDIAQEEIMEAMEEGEREGLLESSDIDMIESIIAFGKVEVSQVMTPRTEMVCLDLEDPLDTNIQSAIECGHSRIPVCRRTKDDIVGMLYVKDLLALLYRRESFELESVLRKPYLAAHDKKIENLLQEFKDTRMHIAIVQDEHGGTAGLVTIEDILEEIVGEIGEEHETEEPEPIVRVSENIVDVEASTHIDDLNDKLGLDLPEAEDYDTLGGLVCSRLGQVPQVGYVTELNGLRLEVTEADERRVLRLRLYLTSASQDVSPNPT